MKRILSLTLVLCLILALSGCAVTGGSTKSVKLHKGTLDSEFSSLLLDVDVADIVIEPGDRFYVKYALCHEPEVDTADGVLTIREKAEGRWWENISFGKSGQPYVMVTVPADADLSRVAVHVDVGDVKISGLAFDTLDLETDVGDLDAQSVSVAAAAELETDVGNIECRELTAGGTLLLATDTGDIRFDGAAAAINAEADVGDLALTLAGAEADWALTLKTDTGDVTIDGRGQGNRCETGSGPNTLTAEADVGDVEIAFAG